VGSPYPADVPVGDETLPVATLAGTLYRAFEGRPALVVGGGPSAPAEYSFATAWLPRPLIVSANGHAAKLGAYPDFIVCKDHRHTETGELMEGLLRPIGAPIVSRHYWADYRLTGWPIQGNSGLMALGFAVMLGCRPVIPVGFDCYQNGTYFHAPDAKNVSVGLRETIWDSRMKRLAGRLEGAPIRPLAGPLSRVFPRFDPTERFARFHMPVALEAYEQVSSTWVRVLRPFQLRGEKTVEVPAGRVLPVDGAELRAALLGGHVEILDSAPAPVVSSCAQATAVEGSTPSPFG
jgi:hypothetical protein